VPIFSRTFLRLLLSVLFVLAAAPYVHAEKRIGVIMTGDIPYYGVMHDAFVAELNSRFAGGERVEIILQRPFPNPLSWSNAARKLIAFDVDLIVTYGSPATQAVIHERSRIPLVYAGVYDTGQEIAAAENATGCSSKIPLSSIVRYVKRLKPVDTLGIVFNSMEEDSVRQYKAMAEFAGQQGMEVAEIDIRSRPDLEKLKVTKADAVFITGSSLAHLWLDEILNILRKEQIPAADIFPDDSQAGVLLSLYQPPLAQGQMAAEMVSKILRGGEKPASIPPHIFRDTELVFNLVSARYLGITFPIQMISEATRVVQ
jgi:putative ABC transport system substrate-binding protein